MVLVMSNILLNWWRSQQFKSALQRGDIGKAISILKTIQKSGARLSWTEKLFRDKLLLERNNLDYKKEIASLSKKFQQASQQAENLQLIPDSEFIHYIYQSFKLIENDEYKIQSTGIYQPIFDDLENQLVEYLQTEFSKIPEQQLSIRLEDALEDINSLKIGQDPDYRFILTPHVYFMKYFLENVYCLYLAWFLIYQHGLLPTKFNILDIAAGPGTSAYGLALLFQSFSNFFEIPQMHVSYYSLEKQDAFQYRGLQFWRKYIESRITPVNTFFRFVTSDIFDLDVKSSNIPPDFFDFIVISHCFFADHSKRSAANSIYKQIFANCLKNQGYVLLIVQNKKLFKAYNSVQYENQEQEKIIVNKFIAELDLELVWYKYLTSTALRKPLTGSEFAKFARENLPKQLSMTPLLQKYLGQKYHTSYTLDDYVILAKKSC